MEQLFLHKQHQSLGAHMKTEFEIEVPRHYGDPLVEYQAVRNGVALADLSYQGKYIVSGADAASFLQGLISNDLSAASNPQGIYTTLLTAKGKIVADFHLFPLPEGYLMEIEWGNAEKTRNHLMRFRLRSKVEMTVPPWGKLLVSGPLSTQLMEKVFGAPLPDMAENTFFQKELNGEQVLCIKRSITGETDFHVYYPSGKMEFLWQMFMSEGRTLNIQPTGQDALEILRIEAGKPKYGMELDEGIIPVEAGIQDEVISYTKGCFPGQEVVARIKTYGHVNRLLSGFILEGDVAPSKGTPIFNGDKKVGWVTSAVYSPFVGKLVSLGYVRRELASPGTAVQVMLSDEAYVPTEVVALPFYKK